MAAWAEPPRRDEVRAAMGLPSEGDLVRGQLDTVGFAVTRAQAEDVHRAALEAVAGDLAAQDARLEMAERFLSGPLRSQPAHELLETLVDPADVRHYRLPWCGRFSVPFGMELVRRTAERLGEPPPVGAVLATGTSLSSPQLAVSDATRRAGLGTTAPSNLHHWVGYVAAGSRPAPS